LTRPTVRFTMVVMALDRHISHRGFDLRQLRAFVATVELGSVTAAAKSLRLAQSTVSEALASLERALGAVLLRHERGTHTVTLTAAGRTLEVHARKVLAAVDETYSAIAQTSTLARGTVNIIANESISTYILSGALAPLRQTWRNTKFTVTVGTCNEVRRGVSALRFDVGLLLETVATPSRISKVTQGQRQALKRLTLNAAVDLVIFTTPAHPLLKSKQRVPLTKSALEDYPVFISDAAGDFHVLLDQYFRNERLPGPRLESTGSVEGVKAGVVNDPRGIGVLPLYAVSDELRTRQFCALQTKPHLPQMQVVGLLAEPNQGHPSTHELIQSIERLLTPTAESRSAADREHRRFR
jgi:DNA-binding transcriptional LysR family regulator